MQISFEYITKMMEPVQKLQATFTTQEQYDLLNQIIVNYSNTSLVGIREESNVSD